MAYYGDPSDVRPVRVMPLDQALCPNVLGELGQCRKVFPKQGPFYTSIGWNFMPILISNAMAFGFPVSCLRSNHTQTALEFGDKALHAHKHLHA